MAIVPKLAHRLVMPHVDDALKGVEAAAAREEKRRLAVVAIAKEGFQCDGDLEIDDDAKVSEGEENGAYVAAWVWVPFDGTLLDKGGGEEQSEPEGDASMCLGDVARLLTFLLRDDFGVSGASWEAIEAVFGEYQQKDARVAAVFQAVVEEDGRFRLPGVRIS